MFVFYSTSEPECEIIFRADDVNYDMSVNDFLTSPGKEWTPLLYLTEGQNTRPTQTVARTTCIIAVTVLSRWTRFLKPKDNWLPTWPKDLTTRLPGACCSQPHHKLSCWRVRRYASWIHHNSAASSYSYLVWLGTGVWRIDESWGCTFRGCRVKCPLMRCSIIPTHSSLLQMALTWKLILQQILHNLNSQL